MFKELEDFIHELVCQEREALSLQWQAKELCDAGEMLANSLFNANHKAFHFSTCVQTAKIALTFMNPSPDLNLPA
jgi:hypothetical protein